MTTSLLEGRARSGFDRRKPWHWIAFGLGSGLSPWAPGTAGTLTAVPLYLAMAGLSLPWYLGLVALATLVGVWACGATARDLGRGDPGAIVWDEVVGFLVTMTAAPPGWLWIFLGFALFRLIDIWKPWPIRVLDARVHGGLGIMLDDLVAGALAWAVLQGIARFAD